MARVSSPPLPPPGTSHPSSPTSAFIPSPAATTKGATPCRTSALPPMTPGSSPLSPVSSVPFFSTVGRSNAQRWSNDTPPAGKSGGCSPTFMEALLLGAHQAMAMRVSLSGAALLTEALLASDEAHQMALAVAGDASPRAVPRIILRDDGRGHMKTVRVPGPDGWSQVESRRQRQKHRR
ncbi:unnamed protein product [Urochloa humidicola]